MMEKEQIQILVGDQPLENFQHFQFHPSKKIEHLISSQVIFTIPKMAFWKIITQYFMMMYRADDPSKIFNKIRFNCYC